MSRTSRAFRKIIVIIVGFPLLLLGIVLIPLPGPGLLTTALALFVLSLEFDWAVKALDKTKAELKKIYDKAKERADAIEGKDK